MASPSVLTITVNPALDVAATVDYLVPDHKLVATDGRRDPGGGGVNVSRVLDRLGVGSRAWIAVGGAVGEELVMLVEAEGIDVAVHRVPGTTRESMAITDRKAGHQYRIVLPGPTLEDPEALLGAIAEAATDVQSVVVSGGLAPGLPDAFYATVCEALPGVTTVVDTKGEALARVVEGSATVVKPSRRELASLVPWVPADLDELELAARQVLDRGGVGALAVSLGADGAMLVERDGACTRYEPPDVDVVSTVGSGDAMVAGIVAGLTAGESLVDATKRGVAAGAATVLTPGTDLCHLDDVARLLDEVVLIS